MTLGDWSGRTLRIVTTLWAAALLALTPQIAVAQDAAAEAPAAVEAAAETAGDTATAEASGYTPLGPEWIKGQPTERGYDVQEQYSDIGAMAKPFHYGLFWVMVVI